MAYEKPHKNENNSTQQQKICRKTETQGGT